MKSKTTRKEIKNKIPSDYIWQTSYGAMQHLLYYQNPIAYTSGVYGWNFDLYDIDRVYFTTGYRNMVGKQIDYNLLNKYENQAEEIINSWDKYKYEEKKDLVNNLLKEFIKELYQK